MKIEIDETAEQKIIRLEGEFFLDNLKFVEETWDRLKVIGPRVVAIDFSGVTSIDSSALGLLVKIFNNSINLKIELIFIDLSEYALKLFKAARLMNFFKILEKKQYQRKYMS